MNHDEKRKAPSRIILEATLISSELLRNWSSRLKCLSDCEVALLSVLRESIEIHPPKHCIVTNFLSSPTNYDTFGQQSALEVAISVYAASLSSLSSRFDFLFSLDSIFECAIVDQHLDQ